MYIKDLEELEEISPTDEFIVELSGGGGTRKITYKDLLTSIATIPEIESEEG